MCKFLHFQDVVLLDFPCTLPSELNLLFQAHSSKMKEIVQGGGSVYATHVDSALLSSYLQNAICPLHLLDACAKEFYHLPSRRYQRIFSSSEVIWLSEVYKN